MPKTKNEGGNMRMKMHAAPVVNFESTNANIAKMSEKNVDIDAASEGDRGGSERNKEYDPRDNLGVQVFKSDMMII